MPITYVYQSEVLYIICTVYRLVEKVDFLEQKVQQRNACLRCSLKLNTTVIVIFKIMHTSSYQNIYSRAALSMALSEGKDTCMNRAESDSH